MRQKLQNRRFPILEVLESRQLLSVTPSFAITTIGDSISSGLSPADADRLGVEPRDGYRPALWDTVEEAFGDTADIDFVGASTYNPTDLPDDGMQHSAYRGFTTYSFFPFESNPNIGSDPEGIPNENSLNADGWATFDVDVALIMLGINDVFEGRLVESIEDGLRDIIGELRNDNAEIDILLGTLTPVDETRANFDMVPAVNEMIVNMTIADAGEGWSGSTETSPIHIVDHYNGQSGLPAFDLGLHSVDGAHPNAAGDQLLADNWWTVLEPIIANAVNVDEPPVDEPPVDEPPVDEPPVDEPPVDEPPVDEPPVDEPPVDEPPVDEPPVDEPPVDEPPVDEPPSEPVFVSIGTAEKTVLEGGTTHFVVTRTGDLSEPTTVFYSTAGAAEVGSDYKDLPLTAEIPAGERAAIIEVVTIDDELIERPESLTLQLSESGSYSLADASEATVTIRNNDLPRPLAPRVSVEASQALVREGGTAVFTFTRRALDISHDLEIAVEATGTAKINSDYKTSISRVIIPGGKRSVEVTVFVKDDGHREGNETIEVAITKAGRYEITDASAKLIIVDNDRPLPAAANITEAVAASIASDRANENSAVKRAARS